MTAAVLKKLAGSNLFDEDEKNTVYGTAFKHFGENEDAKTACRAIGRSCCCTSYVHCVVIHAIILLIVLQVLWRKQDR